MKKQILFAGIVAAFILIKVSHVNAQWSLTGNGGTNPPTNFLGTTDSKDLVLKTNNNEQMRITSGSRVGIGTTSPSAKLHVKSDVNTNPFQVSISGNTKLITKTNGGTMIGYGSTNTPPDDGLLVYGNVGIGLTSPVAKLQVADYEVDLTSGGSLILGTTSGVNMAFDANEIHARSNGVAATLYLNPLGGTVAVNNSGAIGGLFRVGAADGYNMQLESRKIQTYNNGGGANLYINPDGGTVTIGVPTTSSCLGDCDKLRVCGTIKCKELKIESGWCDYVFDKNYNLMPLSQVLDSIQLNKHLPNIPSACEVEQEGLQLGDISRHMMEKIEELTLYLISQDEKIQQLEEKLGALESTQSTKN